MKKKRLLIMLFMIQTTICGCSNNVSSESDIKSENENINISIKESENMKVSNSENRSSFEKESNLIEDTLLLDIDEINLYSFKNDETQYNETYYLGDEIVAMNYKYKSADSNVAVYEDGYLKACGVGMTTIRVTYENYYKDIKINVTNVDTNATSFKFNKSSLKGKKLIVFGDSVSAQATIGTDKTYSQLLEENMEMSSRENFAIGGTTLTYTFLGSNIYKEYHKNDGTLVVDDAVTNVSKHLDACKDADYIFIAYGHNDQYYQEEIDSQDNQNNLDSLDNCISFKGSFRWIIRKIRSVNPSVRFVVLNCTYSQYDITKDTRYGTKYSYLDYRNAAKEIAIEYGCRYLDPWDYLKPFFSKSGYYKDSVHLTKLGHEELYKFIINN